MSFEDQLDDLFQQTYQHVITSMGDFCAANPQLKICVGPVMFALSVEIMRSVLGVDGVQRVLETTKDDISDPDKFAYLAKLAKSVGISEPIDKKKLH